MKQISFLILLTLTLCCTGCDGYIRALYLLKPEDPKPSWSMSNKTISIQGNENIPELVTQVSKELGLKRDNPDLLYWYTGTPGHRFSMELKKSEKNVWIVLLLDWPTTTRSDKSKTAEDKISGRLKAQQGR